MNEGVQVRRGHGRLAMLGAGAVAMGWVLLAAGTALAAPGSSTSVIVSGHTQSHEGSDTELMFDAQSQTQGAGVSNHTKDFVTAPHGGESFGFSVLNGDYFGPAEASGGAALRVSAENFLKIDHLTGSTDMASFSSASASDTLTISGAPSDHRLVNVHTDLGVFTGVATGAQAILDTFNDSSDFDVTGVSQLHISGTGLGAAPFGGDLFGETDFHVEPGHESRAVFDEPTFIPVDLTMTLGQATDLGLIMSLTETLNMTDRRGTLDANFDFADGAEIFWAGGGVQVTDAATGKDLCGLTISSASGVNYGSVAACPGGGGGGAGGVPEPSAWALLIMGFGLAGATLRRSSRALAA
jgi:hypothetical protein